MDIKTGNVVRVKVKRTPVSEAAAKTLSRIFMRDPANKPKRGKRKKLLQAAFRSRRRGGRPWEIRSKAPRLIQPGTGDSCSVRATTSVIRDLKSVSRYVDLSA